MVLLILYYTTEKARKETSYSNDVGGVLNPGIMTAGNLTETALENRKTMRKNAHPFMYPKQTLYWERSMDKNIVSISPYRNKDIGGQKI